ncbi:MAG: polysaccharide deacetylase family protein [Solirubrobacterales bacterium]|nr:polysaccharide deacetylase family protein [Solirubrobacterales bacterium]
MRVGHLITLGAVLAATAAATAGAATVQHVPLAIQTASLTQSGQDLVWTVRLDHSFSPTAMQRERRSLCLLIERAGNGTVSGQVCIAPPARRQRTPLLRYMHITAAGPGPAHVVPATIARSSTRELTATFLPTSFGLAYRPLRWQVISTLAPPGCTPPRPDRVGCYILFPARPALARLHTPRLLGCTASGASFVTDGPTNRREIALTFDDGPWPDTGQFLDVLEHYRVPATFFEIGDQIATYGEGGAIERRMLADGDMIGDHTWSHPDVAGDGSFARQQIEMTAAAIRGATGGFTPCLFRAPYGAVSSALIGEARSMGFTTIQWDIDPRDWALPGSDAIYQNVVGNAHPGAIIIQHDGGGNRSETLAALPREIATLISRGYQFVTITDLLGQQLIYR